jgi:hypothetical protein
MGIQRVKEEHDKSIQYCTDQDQHPERFIEGAYDSKGWVTLLHSKPLFGIGVFLLKGLTGKRRSVV